MRHGTILAAVYAMALSIRDLTKVCPYGASMSQRYKAPTLRDQFSKHRPQGYKKHLRRKR